LKIGYAIKLPVGLMLISHDIMYRTICWTYCAYSEGRDALSRIWCYRL